MRLCARAYASSASMVRPSRAGTATLSAAVRFDNRLGNWKMKPTWRERKVARSLSGSVHTSVPSSSSLPSVGLVRAPSIAISVDLPEPDRPTIDTNSPAFSSRLAPRTASYPGAAPYRLVNDCADKITSAPFGVNECIRRRSAHPPRRQQGANETENGREQDRNYRADLQYRERWPREWD